MKVQVKNVSGCAKELEVEVPVEAVQNKVDDIYQRISQEAKLPGFRKGKAPMDVVKKQYKSAVREEIVHHEMPEFFRTALLENKISPVAQPKITRFNFEEGSPLQFAALVETKPEFQLKNYKGIPVKAERIEVAEAEVEKALGGMREHAAQFVPTEDTASQNGDLMVIDFEGKIDGKPFEGGKSARYPVVLGAAGLLKDFENNLIGLKKGATKTFEMTFPTDYAGKEVAGKKAEFAVVVHEVKGKKLPELDDQFAKDMGRAETLQELKEKIRTQLKESKESEQRAKMIDQIAEKLIAEHPLDLPASLIQQEHQRLVNQGVERLQRQGIDVNKLSDDQKKEFVDKTEPHAKRNVHMSLIVEKITEAEKVECSDKDLETYYEKLAKNLNQTLDSVKRYVKQQGVEAVKDWVQYEKTLDLLVDSAKKEIA